MSQPTTLSQRLLRNDSVDDVTATQTVAFLVVECGVRVDLKDIENLTLNDPFVQALMEAWRVKQDRESDRFGTIAAACQNAFGGKAKATDFFRYISEGRIRQQEATKEAELKAFFATYNARIKQ